MEDESSFIQKIIAESKKLTEANVKKCEYERILKELTLLKNFCNINDDKTSNQTLEKVFQISMQVVQGQLNVFDDFVNETVLISVQNISKTFTFNPSYWQFIVDIGRGKKVSSWSLENELEPGQIEKFSTSFFGDFDLTPKEIHLKLLFSIKFKEHSFVKTVSVSKLLLDVLYLLAPARTPRNQMSISSSSRFPKALFLGDENNDRNNLTMTENEKQLPSVTQFFFKFDSEMLKFFIEKLFLKDSLCRGFTSIDLSQNISSAFKVYYQEEEITVTPKPALGTVSFKSSNPRLLCALKIAILQRLVDMQNVKVICPSDSVSEKCYSFKLKLEELSRPKGTGAIDVIEVMDLYLELRDISETIEFIFLSDVE